MQTKYLYGGIAKDGAGERESNLYGYGYFAEFTILFLYKYRPFSRPPPHPFPKPNLTTYKIFKVLHLHISKNI